MLVPLSRHLLTASIFPARAAFVNVFPCKYDRKRIEERVRLNVSIMSAHFQNELVIRAEFAGKRITGIVIESWGQV